VNESQIETSTRYVGIALAEGAKLLTGGQALTQGSYAAHFLCAHSLRGVTLTCASPAKKSSGP